MIRMMLLQLRRDRLIMAIWILGIALLTLGSVGAIVGTYATVHDRQEVLTLALATPSVLALRGLPDGSSMGSMLMFELFTYLAVVVGLMNTFFATRHGRADEERGRRELVGSTPVGRTTPLAATLVLGVILNVVLGLLIAGAFAVSGQDGPGSLTVGAAFAATGIAFLGVGILAGELAASSRGANGIGATVVLAAYVLRAAGDALGAPDLKAITLAPAWPSWVSPIGWGQQTFALTQNRWWLLLLSVGLAAVASIVAFALHARRDIGESLLPEREGRATASAALRGSLGLAWRLHRSAIIGFAIGGGVLGLFTGSLANAVGSITSNGAPEIVQTLKLIAPGGRNDLVSLFLSTIMVLVGLLAASAGIQGVLRARQEEADGRSELVAATPIPRWRPVLDAVVVGAIATIVVMLAAGVLAWLDFLALGDAHNGAVALGQALIQLPAVLVFVGLAALAVSILPRAAIATGWALFGIGVVLGMFGKLLKLPDWMVDISPFTHIPAIPFTDWGPTAILIAIAVVLSIGAVVLARRRDLTT
jgi:ABC-2 type transport system permease protein